MSFLINVLIVSLAIVHIQALDNGVALRPPMGWLSWARYACEVDCDKYPDICIHENLYKKVADLLVSEGFKDAGYDTVHIDDCWSEKQRDPLTQKLVPDRTRFPSGMKALADYVHGKGLKLGIYGDVGPITCAKYPAQNGPGQGYFELDAQTFAEWGIDAFKFDGCFEDPYAFDELYPRMSKALNKTGASILYHCEWPLYQTNIGISPDYDAIAKYCNMWRNHGDVEDRWTSITEIIDYYAANQELFAKYQSPGAWNDPDMLLIGNFGLTKTQSETQMAMWSMWSAPLYMSNDLANLDAESKKILLNKKVIAVNQDPLGKFAKRVLRVPQTQSFQDYEAWVKELAPRDGQKAWAVTYLSRYPLGSGFVVSIPVKQLINCESGTFEVEDLFADHSSIPDVKCEGELDLFVLPSGSVRMVTLKKKAE